MKKMITTFSTVLALVVSTFTFSTIAKSAEFFNYWNWWTYWSLFPNW